MQFSRFTDYSLRVLLFVAANNNRLTTLAEIAAYYDISIEHLRKVVYGLSKTGYLKTFRGKNGGIQLGFEPSDINIGSVVNQTEGEGSIIDCSGQSCRLNNMCVLQPVLSRAKQAFMDVLSEFTLADLMQDEQMRTELIVSDNPLSRPTRH